MYISLYLQRLANDRTGKTQEFVFMYFMNLIISKVCDPAGPVDTQPREHCKERGTFHLICFKVPAPGEMSHWS